MEQSPLQGVNQQAISEREMGWLGGIIDGEGSIGAQRRFINSDKPKSLLMIMQLTNTSEVMIEKVVNLLDRMGIKHYINSSHLSYVNPNHKDVYHVRIHRVLDMEKFLRLIMPYLVVKRPQAALATRFVKSRLDRRAIQGNPVPYSDDEIDMCRGIIELNKDGPIESGSERVLNDYTPEAQKV